MLELYQNIKARRISLGMTQTELANKMGYADKGMISRIESGKIDIPLSKVKAFASVLGVSASDLMGWDGSCDAPPLRPDEAELLDLYNSTSLEGQQAILEVVKTITNTFK